MYTSKRIIVLCLIVSIVACSSCKKNSAPDNAMPNQSGHSPGPCVPSVESLTDPGLLACKYLPGSYWVFKDSLSGGIDTLFVQELKPSPHLMSSYSCVTFEDFIVESSFKKENVEAYKTTRFYISVYYKHVTFYNDYMPATISQRNEVLMYGPNTIMHDSLLLNGTFYKNVAETGAMQFVKNDPNLMESQSVKLFFSPELGTLQIDYRDRLSGLLMARRQVINKVIMR
jgi:hypothetical protein